MKKLAQIIARLKGGNYDGMMIIKNKWLKEDGQDTEEPIIVKENKRMLVCKAQYSNASLTTTMLSKPRGSAAEADSIPDAVDVGIAGQVWKSFSREDVVGFVKEIGDTNPIHRTDKPVVPGMLLLACIKEELPSDIQELELTYRNAVFAEDPLELIIEGNSITLKGRTEFVTGSFK